MSEKIRVLRVGAKCNGYRRAGLLFGEVGACIPLSSLTSHQVKELTHDRMLNATELEVVIVDEAELENLRKKEFVADELGALLPSDFTWTRTPVEYVANLAEQLRVQTERANGLQASNDTLRAQLDELEAKVAAKSGNAAGRR